MFARHVKIIYEAAGLRRFRALDGIRLPLILIGLGLCCKLGAVAAGEGVGGVTKGAIEAVWKAAASRLRCARVEYVTKKTFKVVKDPTRYAAKLKERPPNEFAPARYYLTRISLDGPLVRREVLSKGATPDGPPARMSLEVTDGKKTKSLTMPGELSVFPNPVGQIHRANVPLMLYLIDNQPMLFVMSRSDPAMASFHPQFDEFHVVKTTERLDGVDCVHLEAGDPKARKKVWVANGTTYTDGNDHTYSQLWLAPAMDYSVVRYAQFIEGRLRERIDLRYRKDERGNWVPESWTIELPERRDPTKAEFRQSRIVKWESNPRFARSEWDFDFPRDAQISDRD